MKGSLSLAEVAERLGCSAEEVRRALQEGWFPGRFVVSGEVRIPSTEVEEATARWSDRPSDTGAELAQPREVERWVRDVLVAERASLARELGPPLEDTRARLTDLEEEVSELRALVRQLGSGSPDGTTNDVRRLIREIADLEELLDDHSA